MGRGGSYGGVGHGGVGWVMKSMSWWGRVGFGKVSHEMHFMVDRVGHGGVGWGLSWWDGMGQPSFGDGVQWSHMGKVSLCRYGVCGLL